MRYTDDFNDYELLDMSNGEKLEKWGKYILIRPDPQIVWREKENPDLWKLAHARYIRSNTGGGHWEKLKNMDESWKIKYKDMNFNLKLMGFKHTGLFPEQSVNWNYMQEKIENRLKNKNEVKVLNLFAYTGGASIACSKAGASVCHVDSSQGMTNWAKDNARDSGISNIRFIVDDVLKFVNREIRRNNKYDCIIMDPPSYGRGKSGEVWSIENNLYDLVAMCSKILSDNPLFLVINTYTGGLSGTIIKNIVRYAIGGKMIKTLECDEIGLRKKDSKIFLPCGITTICEF